MGRRAIMMAIATSRKKKELPYLCFTAREDNSTIRLDKVGTPPNISLQYSYDGNNWEDYTWSGDTDVQGDPITLATVGNKVYFKAKTTNGAFSSSNSNYHRFMMSGKIAASGDIQSLVDNAIQSNTAATRQYFSLFNGCSALTSAPKLPAIQIGQNSYRFMFKDCTSIEKVKMDAVTFDNYACFHMFNGCTNLKEIKVKFDNWATSYSSVFSSWVDGVATSGTLICPSALGTDANIERSVSRCPTGWTVTNND